MGARAQRLQRGHPGSPRRGRARTGGMGLSGPSAPGLHRLQQLASGSRQVQEALERQHRIASGAQVLQPYRNRDQALREQPAQKPAAQRRSGQTAGRALPQRLRGPLEAAAAVDLSAVRVHRNSPLPRRLGARAFSRGLEVHLGPGQERHLEHEAWHVVQQVTGRVRPTAHVHGQPMNDDARLEAEADAAGRALSAGRPLPTTALATTTTAPAAQPTAVVQRKLLFDGRGADDKALADRKREALRKCKRSRPEILALIQSQDYYLLSDNGMISKSGEQKLSFIEKDDLEGLSFESWSESESDPDYGEHTFALLGTLTPFGLSESWSESDSESDDELPSILLTEPLLNLLMPYEKGGSEVGETSTAQPTSTPTTTVHSTRDVVGPLPVKNRSRTIRTPLLKRTSRPHRGGGQARAKSSTRQQRTARYRPRFQPFSGNNIHTLSSVQGSNTPSLPPGATLQRGTRTCTLTVNTQPEPSQGTSPPPKQRDRSAFIGVGRSVSGKTSGQPTRRPSQRQPPAKQASKPNDNPWVGTPQTVGSRQTNAAPAQTPQTMPLLPELPKKAKGQSSSRKPTQTPAPKKGKKRTATPWQRGQVPRPHRFPPPQPEGLTPVQQVLGIKKLAKRSKKAYRLLQKLAAGDYKAGSGFHPMQDLRALQEAASDAWQEVGKPLVHSLKDACLAVKSGDFQQLTAALDVVQELVSGRVAALSRLLPYMKPLVKLVKLGMKIRGLIKQARQLRQVALSAVAQAEYIFQKLARKLAVGVTEALVSTGKLVLSLFTLFSGGASSPVTESLKLVLLGVAGAKEALLAGKAVFKHLSGTKGIHRELTANELVVAAFSGDLARAQLILQLGVPKTFAKAHKLAAPANAAELIVLLRKLDTDLLAAFRDTLKNAMRVKKPATLPGTKPGSGGGRPPAGGFGANPAIGGARK